MSGSLIQIENRKTLWTVSTPACVSWVCVDGSSARKPGSHNLPVDSAVKGVKRVNFWDTKILQLTRYRMSLSKILAHLRQSWYTLGDNNYYNVNNNNNNNSIKHLSRLFLSHGSRVMICIILDWVRCLCDPRVSPVVNCAAMEGSASNASVVLLCVRFSDLSVCFVSMNVWSESGFSSMIGAGSLSEASLGLGDVDFDAVGAFRGRVLSYWCRALCCHQPLSGFLSLLIHSWVHAPVLPRWQLGLRLLLWHRWWKLLVFILLLWFLKKLPVVGFKLVELIKLHADVFYWEL